MDHGCTPSCTRVTLHERQPKNLSLNVLRWRGLAPAPQANATDGRKGEKYAKNRKRTVTDQGHIAYSLPKCNAETPNRLHLQACAPGGTDPIVGSELAAVLVDIGTERGSEVVGRTRVWDVGSTNDLTLQVGERSSDGDGDDDHRNKHHAIHGGIDEEWQNVVDV